MTKSILLDGALRDLPREEWGSCFEDLCCALLERCGFTIHERPFDGSDSGVDMVAVEPVRSLTNTAWDRSWGVQAKFSGGRSVSLDNDILNALETVRQRGDLFGLLLITNSSVAKRLGEAVARSAPALKGSLDVGPPLVVWPGSMIDRLLTEHIDLMHPIRYLRNAATSAKHIALVSDLPQETTDAICRGLIASADGQSSTHGVCLQCSASEDRIAREQLVALVAARGLRPCTIDHEEGLASAAGGEYDPRWPAVIAGRCDVGTRSLSVVSQNTSSFVGKLRDPLIFLGDGERRMLSLIDEALQSASVTELWCTYRLADLREIEDAGGPSVRDMLCTLHGSHDLVIAWNRDRWDVCEDPNALIQALDYSETR